MKYFSPSVLDGSITTAKLADLAVTAAKLAGGAVTTAKIQLFSVTTDRLGPASVTQGKLDNSSTSQSGALPGGGEVLVSLSAFSFFPDLEASEIADEQVILTNNLATPSATADSPQFRIQNTVGPGRLYSVAWRRVDA